MSVQKILNEDWSLIDNKKRPEQRGYVSCEEVQEVDYLIYVFRKHYPTKSEKEIIYAIAAGWRCSSTPKPRRQFIELVSSNLFAREALIA